MRRAQLIESNSGDHAVLGADDALAALIAGWRAGWRRRLEWCPQELCVRDVARAKSYQERMNFYARQASG
jgi:hypothetical protein